MKANIRKLSRCSIGVEHGLKLLVYTADSVREPVTTVNIQNKAKEPVLQNHLSIKYLPSASLLLQQSTLFTIYSVYYTVYSV